MRPAKLCFSPFSPFVMGCVMDCHLSSLGAYPLASQDLSCATSMKYTYEFTTSERCKRMLHTPSPNHVVRLADRKGVRSGNMYIVDGPLDMRHGIGFSHVNTPPLAPAVNRLLAKKKEEANSRDVCFQFCVFLGFCVGEERRETGEVHFSRTFDEI